MLLNIGHCWFRCEIFLAEGSFVNFLLRRCTLKCRLFFFSLQQDDMIAHFDKLIDCFFFHISFFKLFIHMPSVVMWYAKSFFKICWASESAKNSKQLKLIHHPDAIIGAVHCCMHIFWTNHFLKSSAYYAVLPFFVIVHKFNDSIVERFGITIDTNITSTINSNTKNEGIHSESTVTSWVNVVNW